MFITQLFLIMLTVEKTDSRLHADQNMVKATATLVSPGNVVFGTVCIQKAAGSDAAHCSCISAWKYTSPICREPTSTHLQTCTSSCKNAGIFFNRKGFFMKRWSWASKAKPSKWSLKFSVSFCANAACEVMLAPWISFPEGKRAPSCWRCCFKMSSFLWTAVITHRAVLSW